MNLNTLSPKQIVFINAINDALIKTYEDVIRDKGITFEQEIPMLGTIKGIKPLDEEQLQEVITNERFNFAKQIQEIFKPVVEIIKESTPELYEEAYDLAGMNKESNDE